MKILSADRFMNPNDGEEAFDKAYGRYEAEINKMAAAYNSHENKYKCIVNVISGTDADKLTDHLDEIKYIAPWFEQFWFLFVRAFTNNLRCPASTLTRYFTVLFTMLLGLALFYNVFLHCFEIVSYLRMDMRQCKVELEHNFS